MENLDSLRFPVGKHELPAVITPEMIQTWIDYLVAFPTLFKEAVEALSEEKLDAPYRPEGWSRRQVVHHVVDSHMNAYIRTKLALTEDFPTIKPYAEAEWAKLPDSALSVDVSLQLLTGLHLRWVTILKQITNWDQGYIHPQYQQRTRLDAMLSLYYWHSRHHLGHINLP
jgi:uncharacterized damage-inducible protein DinB